MLKLFVLIPIMFFCLINSSLGQTKPSTEAAVTFAVS